MPQPQIPPAPTSMTKGASLKEVLGRTAIEYLANNLAMAHKSLNRKRFIEAAMQDIEPLSMMQRGPHIAKVMREHLPDDFTSACEILVASLTPALIQTERNGLSVFFYHPHGCFVSEYGQASGDFSTSMATLHALTQRFTAEFAIRSFLLNDSKRTLKQLMKWTKDPSPHVRRLCSEGCRPRLPWAARLSEFIADPSPTLDILTALKDDSSLYVRRSVANHLGDIAKDHPELVFELCTSWLPDASPQVKWLIRHAVRHPAKTGHQAAQRLRVHAK